MKQQERQKAVRMRSLGASLGEIAKELSVSKGSVSLWVRDVRLTSDQVNKLNKNGFSISAIEKRRKSRLVNEEKKRNLAIAEAGKDIAKITQNELKLIGTALYWAEGGKTKNSVRVSNSDQYIICVMMRFFRQVCSVEEHKFRVQIHTHSHLNIENAENYWSDVTGIPVSQFYKTYAKASVASLHKKDNLPYGTVQIYVCDTKLFLVIKGWTEKIKKLLLP
jgi:transposase